ncbi:MAG: hypothetical protein ACRENJ_03855 [Candidatus Eiseniibacteriota bacterium]
MMGRRDYDCDTLGLDDRQRAALTGFSSRVVGALAHLREAWCVADPENRAPLDMAIRALLATHSLAEIPASCDRVLTYGLDDGLAERMRVAAGLRSVR